MQGDLITRIRQYHPYIGHYHTAGVPGRHEIDGTQEIKYPAVMRAIAETGFAGYVAQEFFHARSAPVARRGRKALQPETGDSAPPTRSFGISGTAVVDCGLWRRIADCSADSEGNNCASRPFRITEMPRWRRTASSENDKEASGNAREGEGQKAAEAATCKAGEAAACKAAEEPET